MCQAGFIHKNTVSCPYQHPFMFCCFLENDFVRFVDEFENIDFTKYKKLYYNSSKIYHHKDMYSWDELNELLNIQTENTPVIEFENGIQLSYPHVEYNVFDEKYKTRLERYIKIPNKNIHFIFRVKNFMDKNLVDRFYENNRYNKIILFDEDVSFRDDYIENETTKILVTYSEHHNLINELKKKNII